MSAVPFAGVGKPFQKHAERHAAGAPRESIDEFEGRAVLALPRAGASKDDERPWFSGQVVAVDGSRRQFQVLATPLPPCEDGCKCSGGDGLHRYRLALKDAKRSLSAVVICDASGGDFLRLTPADPSLMSFEPETLLEDDRARNALDTFFPRLAAEADAGFDCCVVVGRFQCKQLLLFGAKRAAEGATPPPRKRPAPAPTPGGLEPDLTPAVRPEDAWIFNRPQGGHDYTAPAVPLTPPEQGGPVPLTQSSSASTPRLELAQAAGP